MYFIFFFKQKTAYEMRISDWSSDVCSSDLTKDIPTYPRGNFKSSGPDNNIRVFLRYVSDTLGSKALVDVRSPKEFTGRSEERRVGKECVSTCRSRWSPYH